jgi:hypothetical protein
MAASYFSISFAVAPRSPLPWSLLSSDGSRACGGLRISAANASRDRVGSTTTLFPEGLAHAPTSQWPYRASCPTGAPRRMALALVELVDRSEPVQASRHRQAYGSFLRAPPHQRRIRVKLFEVTAYRDDVGNRRAAIELKYRNHAIRIQGAERWRELFAVRKSTCTVGTARPFSARKIRTRRGLGAVTQS